MKTCPICTTENSDGAKHCEVCGERLEIPQAAGAAPAATDAPEPSMESPSGGGGFDLDDAGVSAGEPSAVDAAEDMHDPTPPDAAPPVSTQELVGNPDGPKPPSREDSVAALDEFDRLLAEDQAVLDAPEATHQRGRIVGGDTLIDQPAVVKQVMTVARTEAEEVAKQADARLIVYVNKQPVHTHPIVNDETMIGRYDPTSDAYPDLDMTDFDTGSAVSRKHAYIYREGGEYYVYPISNSGTQVGADLLDLGVKYKLANGNVIILAGAIAMKFERKDG